MGKNVGSHVKYKDPARDFAISVALEIFFACGVHSSLLECKISGHKINAKNNTAQIQKIHDLMDCNECHHLWDECRVLDKAAGRFKQSLKKCFISVN